MPQSRITAGRQRIELDDWRFLGAWPFTQNDQTLDAIRVETRALGPGTLDAGLFNRVNRKLGGDNPLGIFRGTSWYANYGVPSPIGRLTAFHYDFSLRTVATNGSSRTTGARILGRRDGDRLSVGWEASYARQRDAHGNPRDFAADYWLGRVTAEAGPWSVSVRAEELGSDAGHPVQTPLGALHGFNGLADRFLRTPADGLRDLSVGLLRHFEGAGPFETLSAGVTYHDFQDADGTRNYGDEIDLHLTARTGDWLLSIEHARYAADTLFTDTQSTVFSVTHLWGSK